MSAKQFYSTAKKLRKEEHEIFPTEINLQQAFDGLPIKKNSLAKILPSHLLADPEFQAQEVVFYMIPAGHTEKGTLAPVELFISPYPATGELGNDIFYLDIMFSIEEGRIDVPSETLFESFNKEEIISFAVCVDVVFEKVQTWQKAEWKVHVLIVTMNPIRSLYFANALVKLFDTWNDNEYPVSILQLAALVAKEPKIPQLLRDVTVETFKCSRLNLFLLRNFDCIYEKLDFCVLN